MIRILILTVLAIAVISCSRGTSSPSSTDNSASSYFVNWTADGQNYSVSGAISSIGGCANNSLAVWAAVNNSYPCLTFGIDSISANSTYNCSASKTNRVTLFFQASSDPNDIYRAGDDDTTASITITNNTSSSVSGSFSGKLRKIIINYGKVSYSYIQVSGTFNVIKVS